MKSPKQKDGRKKMVEKTVAEYQDGLWRAVEEIWTDMYVNDYTPPEIKSLILGYVKIYCDDMKKFAQKELHHISAHKRRKLR
jgi:hypothetical protein